MMPTFIFFTPQQDAYISEFYPNTNFGDVPFLYANLYQGANDEYRFLIQFDLCSLQCNQVPPNSDLEPNALYLHVYRNEIPTTTRLFAYRIKEAWDEDTVTWDNAPLVDYSDPVGYVDIPAGFFGRVDIPLDPEVVQGWYNGFYQNHGLLLQCSEPFNSLIGFFSGEYFDPV